MHGLCNQSVLFPRCAANSIGPANQLFIHMIQTLMTAHCSIAEPNVWPEDYGTIAAKRGMKANHHQYFPINT